MGEVYVWELIILIATIYLVFKCSPKYTFEEYPDPICLLKSKM